ncbi:LysR family transcriptional regulator [Nocardia sp. NPDC005998]|uniref:LysR family transcriptional regulator n=1 Tax=Nocardia sp. NPDC005998 TaxID=3156894 RepID=UPI0033B9897F
MEWSSTPLRVLRAVAEYGSFTAAAGVLGYTQSAVSRQMAALEHAVGETLFERGAAGVRLTPAGRVLLRGASVALDEIDRAAQSIRTGERIETVVRLGMFFSAAPVLVPEMLALVRQRAPHIRIVTREGSTPSLTRSLRAGTLDLAVLGAQPPYPPPDAEDPPLELEVLLEGELAVAVAEDSDLGRDGTVTIAELATMPWVSSTEGVADPAFGVWPALPRRPEIAHRTRDWLSKLTLVAKGYGITTVPPYLASVLPGAVRLVRVVDGVSVTRRASLARMPATTNQAVQVVSACLHEVARNLPTL